MKCGRCESATGFLRVSDLWSSHFRQTLAAAVDLPTIVYWGRPAVVTKRMGRAWRSGQDTGFGIESSQVRSNPDSGSKLVSERNPEVACAAKLAHVNDPTAAGKRRDRKTLVVLSAKNMTVFFPVFSRTARLRNVRVQSAGDGRI